MMKPLNLFILSLVSVLSAAAPSPVSPLQCSPQIYDFKSLAPGEALRQGKDGAWTLKTTKLSATGQEENVDASAIFDSRNPPVHEVDLGTPGECSFGPGIGVGGREGQPGSNCIPLGNLLVAHNGNTTALRRCKCEEYACGNCQPNAATHGAIFKFFFRDAVYFRHIIAVDLEGDESLYVILSNGVIRRVSGLGNNSVQKVVVDMYIVPGQTLALKCTGSCAFAEFVMDVCLPASSMIQLPNSYSPRHVVKGKGDKDVSIAFAGVRLPELALVGLTPRPGGDDPSETASSSESPESTIVESSPFVELPSPFGGAGEPIFPTTPLASDLVTGEPSISVGVEGISISEVSPDVSFMGSEEPVSFTVTPSVEELSPSALPTPEGTPDAVEFSPMATELVEEEPSMSSGMVVMESTAPSMYAEVLDTSVVPVETPSILDVLSPSDIVEEPSPIMSPIASEEVEETPGLFSSPEPTGPSISTEVLDASIIPVQTPPVLDVLSPAGIAEEPTPSTMPVVSEEVEETSGFSSSPEATLFVVVTPDVSIMDSPEAVLASETPTVEGLVPSLLSTLEKTMDELEISPAASDEDLATSSSPDNFDVSSIAPSTFADVTSGPLITFETLSSMDTPVPSDIPEVRIPTTSPSASEFVEFNPTIPTDADVTEEPLIPSETLAALDVPVPSDVPEIRVSTASPSVSEFVEFKPTTSMAADVMEEPFIPDETLLPTTIPIPSDISEVRIPTMSPSAAEFVESSPEISTSPMTSLMEMFSPIIPAGESQESLNISGTPLSEEIAASVPSTPEPSLSGGAVDEVLSSSPEETMFGTFAPFVSMIESQEPLLITTTPSVTELEPSVLPTPEETPIFRTIEPEVSVSDTVPTESVLVSPELMFTMDVTPVLETTPDVLPSPEQMETAVQPSIEATPVVLPSLEQTEVDAEPSVSISAEALVIDSTSTPEPSLVFMQSPEPSEVVMESKAPSYLSPISTQYMAIDVASPSVTGMTSIVDESKSGMVVEETPLTTAITDVYPEPSVPVGMTRTPEAEEPMLQSKEELTTSSISSRPSVAIIDIPLPTAAPLAADPTNIYSCDLVDAPIDFSGLPLGSPVRGGDGYTLRTYRLGPGLDNDTSAIFDTANPRGIDFDLGAPNQNCPNPGPGIGDGGKPGERGENCAPLGNALISHQGNVKKLREVCPVCPSCKECLPNDSAHGAFFVFQFTEWTLLRRIVMLDVDELPSSLSITDSKNHTYEYAGYGDNSKFVIDLMNKRTPARGTLKIRCAGSCAIVEIDRAKCADNKNRKVVSKKGDTTNGQIKTSPHRVKKCR